MTVPIKVRVSHPAIRFWSNRRVEGRIRPKPPTRRKPKTDAPDEPFEQFWSAYPRQIDKPDARKAWDAAIKAGADADAIITITGAERFAAERAAEDSKFTKYPATFLCKGSCRRCVRGKSEIRDSLARRMTIARPRSPACNPKASSAHG